MGVDRDPFCRAAVELGLADDAVAARIEARTSSPATARAHLIKIARISAQDVDRIDQLVRARAAAPRTPTRPRGTPPATARPGRPAGSRPRTGRGRPPPRSGTGSMILAGLGLVAVAGVAAFIVASGKGGTDGSVDPSNDPARTAGVVSPFRAPDPVNTPTPIPTPPPTVDPTPAGPPRVEPTPVPSPSPGPDAAKPTVPPLRPNEEWVDDNAPAPPLPVKKAKVDDDPRARGDRDPKLLDQAEAAFKRGEASNNRVGELEGDEREEAMVEALRAFTEAMALYRKYAGHRFPAFLEKRVQALNSRIALLRKLMPPGRVAEFTKKLTGPRKTAAQLLAEADGVAKAAPRDLTTQFMYYQLVLDEWPTAPEAVVALAAIGRLGWREVEEVAVRRGLRAVVDEWAEWMRAGKFANVEAGIAKLGADEALRTVMRSDDWARVQVFERALRIPKAAAVKFEVGSSVSLKSRKGKSISGRVDRVTETAVVIQGRPIAFGTIDPLHLVRVAYSQRRTGTQELSVACFLGTCGVQEPAMKALAAARKRGAPVTELAAMIERYARTKKKPAR